MPRCNCRLCARSRRIKSVKEHSSRDNLLLLIDELHEELENAEEELEHSRMVLNGTWPHAKEILERSLEKCLTSR